MPAMKKTKTRKSGRQRGRGEKGSLVRAGGGINAQPRGRQHGDGPKCSTRSQRRSQEPHPPPPRSRCPREPEQGLGGASAPPKGPEQPKGGSGPSSPRHTQTDRSRPHVRRSRSPLERRDVLTQATAWASLEDSLLSEVSHPPRADAV